MRNEGGALPYLRPHSPEHVRAIEVSRKHEWTERSRKPAPELDELPTDIEYREYLNTHELDTNEKRLRHERELTEELSEAMLFNKPKEVEAIRKRIWMLSEYAHRTSDTPSEKLLHTLREELLSALHTPIEERGENSDDIKEDTLHHEREIQIWSSLRGALRDHLTGKELLNALKVQDEEESEQTGGYDPLAEFEYRYHSYLRQATHYHDNRYPEAKQEIEKLRPIRDRLYYNLLFPVLAETKYAIEERKKKRQH